uniref:Uncharacterized protein n=1 Tax=Candidatus Kentrum sp. DK TaxID=2126562 RepID=A0A450SZK3_9GAMM|nr:MAG: hypothetical protein BECKDK2373B_GA0170837_10846 [Candidatus Kentron sp. DK]
MDYFSFFIELYAKVASHPPNCVENFLEMLIYSIARRSRNQTLLPSLALGPGWTAGMTW